MPETSASNAEPGPPEAPEPPEPPQPPEAPAPPDSPKNRWGQPKIADPETLRALAHPARLAVWDFLGTCRLEGRDGATATEIAHVVGMTPSAMSYHLRTLAKAGFIEEAPNRGDARERVWRIGLHSFSLGADEDSPESAKLAESAAAQAIAEQTDQHFARWQEAKYQVDPQMRDASMFTQTRMRLTVEEAQEIQEAVHAMLEPYVARTLERADSEGSPEEAPETLLWNFTARLFPHM